MIRYRQFSRELFEAIALSIILSLGSFNVNAADTSSIAPSDLMDRIKSGNAPVVLDVRTPQEFAQGHIEGAVNIPHTELSKRMSELRADKSDEIVVHCRSGVRAGIAEQILTSAGYTQLKDLQGHILKWNELGYPLK